MGIGVKQWHNLCKFGILVANRGDQGTAQRASPTVGQSWLNGRRPEVSIETFDSLAKVLAEGTSRRRALKGAAVVGAGTLLTLFGGQTTKAAKCKDNFQNCAGVCIPPGQACPKGTGGRPTQTAPGQVDR